LLDDASVLGLALPDQPKKSKHFKVHPDNWDAVILFCSLSTQWAYGAMGGVIGLNYAGVSLPLELAIQPDKQADVFAQIQLMERAALKVMNNVK